MTKFINPLTRPSLWAGLSVSALLLLGACGEAPMESRSDLSGAAAPPSEAMIAPAPVIMAEAPMPSSGGRYTNPRRGVVTAGDIDDTLNLAQFQRYQSKTAKRLGLPSTNMSGMVRMQLLTNAGKPAPGVAYNLRKPGAADPFYQGVSGVDGRIAVLPSVHGAGSPKRVELRVFGEGQNYHSADHRVGKSQQVRLPVDGGYAPDFLDLVFVFDTTGSMGDELAWLTKEFSGIVQTARRAAPGANMRFGLVAYRDQGDAYVVRNFGFTKRQGQMQGWLRSLDASGGGDYPEAAAEAMQAAAALNWRRGKGERLVFHIADAPPHKAKASRYIKAARMLAAKDVQIFGLGASGVAEESELMMRQAAALSAGRYMFLTDDSGIGHAHAEPTVACYRVTRLKSLLNRVLTSELTGIRREARASDVIRDVGTYRNGYCRQ